MKLFDRAKEVRHLWRHVWQMAYHTGGRSGELDALRAKNMNLKTRMGFFDEKYNFLTKEYEILKDEEWRQFPINDDLYELCLELQVDKMEPNDFILPRIHAWKTGQAAKVLRAFCEESKIPSICFHTLRACFATHLLQNGVPITKVLSMGGWADLDTMQRYVRLAGVEIEGATNSLSIGRRERPARVLKLIASP
jgi:integrase